MPRAEVGQDWRSPFILLVTQAQHRPGAGSRPQPWAQKALPVWAAVLSFPEGSEGKAHRLCTSGASGFESWLCRSLAIRFGVHHLASAFHRAWHLVGA